ncbi:hypothetical protein RCH09_002962 [Actimicrobium sp. GrIS 1.19]|nr:hypothetical protein [Actimicrobium sp. GrIS 1.19]
MTLDPFPPRLQTLIMIWALSMMVMLEEDVAMLAFMLS